MKKLIYLLPLALLSCGSEEQIENTTEVADNVNSEVVTEDNEIPQPESSTTFTDDCDNETFKKLLSEKNGLLIDVRTPEEFAAGHIENAINIDFKSAEFESIVDTLNVSTPTFVYCQGGTRSSNARDILMSKSFSEVYNLENGYGNWKD